MIRFCLIILCLSTFLFANPSKPMQTEVPKEDYLTFNDFLRQIKSPKIIAPDTWTALAVTKPLIAKYDTQGGILSISTFSGSIGSESANVNRWRRQSGLAPLSNKDALKSLTNRKIGAYTFKYLALSNNQQYVTVYWLQTNSKHIFNKISHNSPINLKEIELFLGQQAWESL